MADTLGYDGGLTCSMGVTNLDKAIEWYTTHLGFELEYKMDEMGWCEMKTHMKGINVGLSQVETVSPEGGATMTFGVKDIAAARKKLEAAKTRFDGETMVIPDMVSLATFFDPDGNKLMLYEVPARG